jgi:hypothetical protein
MCYHARIGRERCSTSATKTGTQAKHTRTRFDADAFSYWNAFLSVDFPDESAALTDD